MNPWKAIHATQMETLQEDNTRLRKDLAITVEALRYIAEKGLGIDEVHIVVKAKSALDAVKGPHDTRRA